jgi:hypothetical protein
MGIWAFGGERVVGDGIFGYLFLRFFGMFG